MTACKNAHKLQKMFPNLKFWFTNVITYDYGKTAYFDLEKIL